VSVQVFQGSKQALCRNSFRKDGTRFFLLGLSSLSNLLSTYCFFFWLLTFPVCISGNGNRSFFLDAPHKRDHVTALFLKNGPHVSVTPLLRFFSPFRFLLGAHSCGKIPIRRISRYFFLSVPVQFPFFVLFLPV